MKNKFWSIAIDGPAGSGKSTIAKKFTILVNGFVYISTGLFYRALAYHLIINKILENEIIDYLSKNLIKIELDENKVILTHNKNKVILSSELRTEEVSVFSSKIANIPEVRNYLIERQQDLAKENNVIMDGRDIGTVILKDADIKIFLTASSETRAKRRYDELKETNDKVSYEEIHKEIIDRDYRDKNRKIAPLIKAEDAIEIDTSNLEPCDVVDKILNLYIDKK